VLHTRFARQIVELKHADVMSQRAKWHGPSNSSVTRQFSSCSQACPGLLCAASSLVGTFHTTGSNQGGSAR
jgi:hypothetical protein